MAHPKGNPDNWPSGGDQLGHFQPPPLPINYPCEMWETLEHVAYSAQQFFDDGEAIVRKQRDLNEEYEADPEAFSRKYDFDLYLGDPPDPYELAMHERYGEAAEDYLEVRILIGEFLSENALLLCDLYLMSIEEGVMWPHTDLVEALAQAPRLTAGENADGFELVWLDRRAVFRSLAALLAQRDLDWLNHLRDGDGEA